MSATATPPPASNSELDPSIAKQKATKLPKAISVRSLDLRHRRLDYRQRLEELLAGQRPWRPLASTGGLSRIVNQELRSFIVHLDRVASKPSSYQSVQSDLLQHLSCKSTNKHDIYERIIDTPAIIGDTRRPYDIVELENMSHLSSYLDSIPLCPAILRRPRTGEDLRPPLDSAASELSIEELFDVILQNPDAQQAVVIADETAVTTSTITVRDMRQRYIDRSENETRPPLNSLDIGNHHRMIRYTPTPIAKRDLISRRAMRQQLTVGRDSQEQPTVKRHKASRVQPSRPGRPESDDCGEWFLLSETGSVSSIHIDAGGQCTWVRIMEGEKWWYYLSNATEADKAMLAELGALQIEHFDGRWVKVILTEGDLL